MFEANSSLTPEKIKEIENILEHAAQEEKLMFDFEIVRNDDGTEVIDRTGCTFYDDLSPSELIDYNEVDDQLYAMEIAERKLRRKRKKELFRRAA